MATDLGQLAAESYQRIAHELMAPLLEMIQVARAECGGDLDKYLVLLAIGARTTRHRRFIEAEPDEFISGRIAVLPGFGAYAQSIAASIGMPKETARRKIAEMVAAGWLVRHDRRLYLTAKCYTELSPLRDHLTQLAVANYRTLDRLVQASGARSFQA
jgi:hypothetical protein